MMPRKRDPKPPGGAKTACNLRADLAECRYFKAFRATRRSSQKLIDSAAL